MRKPFIVALASACAAAHAQTPAIHAMPGARHGMCLGAQYAPRHECMHDRHATALPMPQVEWNNGVFIPGISAMSTGMHLLTALAHRFR